MAKLDWTNSEESRAGSPTTATAGRAGPPPLRRSGGGTGGGGFSKFVALLLVVLIGYGGYFWLVRRVVVGPGQVLLLLKKNGSRSLPNDQVVIPRKPLDQAAAEAWQKEFGDCNGVMEETYKAGTYFGFSPFDYERILVDTVEVQSKEVGVVIRKFGQPLPPGQVLADPEKQQRGPLPIILQPAQYPEYSNSYAYEVRRVPPIQVDPGYRGVVTVMSVAGAAGELPKSKNDYLVEEGTLGVQPKTEPEGFRYINPYQKRVMPITIRSQRFEMSGKDAIRFPSSDSFDITMEGFVEWAIIPDRLPEMYVKFGEGGELIPLLETTMILPYSRSLSRLVGSQYNARDFISGDTKLKFQKEFEDNLRAACNKQGVEILQALVRDIIPPNEIKQPINEREIAKQQILQYEQQIKVAQSQAKLATQEETGTQNKAIGEANKQVVTLMKKAEQDRDVAVTEVNQKLAVVKLKLEAAQKQADAQVARGQADANVVLLKKQAEAEPLKSQVLAFGDGDSYARNLFYQKVAPSLKSILTSTDGPFADIFKQFIAPNGEPSVPQQKLTGAQQTAGQVGAQP